MRVAASDGLAPIGMVRSSTGIGRIVRAIETLRPPQVGGSPVKGQLPVINDDSQHNRG